MSKLLGAEEHYGKNYFLPVLHICFSSSMRQKQAKAKKWALASSEQTESWWFSSERLVRHILQEIISTQAKNLIGSTQLGLPSPCGGASIISSTLETFNITTGEGEGFLVWNNRIKFKKQPCLTLDGLRIQFKSEKVNQQGRQSVGHLNQIVNISEIYVRNFLC